MLIANPKIAIYLSNWYLLIPRKVRRRTAGRLKHKEVANPKVAKPCEYSILGLPKSIFVKRPRYKSGWLLGLFGAIEKLCKSLKFEPTRSSDENQTQKL